MYTHHPVEQSHLAHQLPRVGDFILDVSEFILRPIQQTHRQVLEILRLKQVACSTLYRTIFHTRLLAIMIFRIQLNWPTVESPKVCRLQTDEKPHSQQRTLAKDWQSSSVKRMA